MDSSSSSDQKLTVSVSVNSVNKGCSNTLLNMKDELLLFLLSTIGIDIEDIEAEERDDYNYKITLNKSGIRKIAMFLHTLNPSLYPSGGFLIEDDKRYKK